jgi:hypothetical protein
LSGAWSESGTTEVSGLGAAAAVLETAEAGPIWLTGVETVPGGVRFRVESGRSYTVVGPDAVLNVAEVRKPLETVLKSTRIGADYVAIGPREFVEAAGPLLDSRRDQGLLARGVALEEVYSEFGFGEETPKAIRDFLSYAYHSWKVAPRYVVLLGDATFDFKDRLGTGIVNQVPPWMVKTTYIETASDPAYAAVNGEDLLPDLAIGRLPAASLEELQTMIQKILMWESSGGVLDDKVVLVTDNPDAAGDFVADAEELAHTILSAKDLRKIYLSTLGAAATRGAVRDAFDEGSALMNYIGHGAIHVWAAENILNIMDVGNLAPQDGQPILLTMNCLNGYFHFPYFDALAESLLKAEGKGAIAAFSPSGLSLNDAAHVFHRAMLVEILEGGHNRLGDAVLAAQATYAESGALPEMLAIYHLFGDPAMKLR